MFFTPENILAVNLLNLILEVLKMSSKKTKKNKNNKRYDVKQRSRKAHHVITPAVVDDHDFAAIARASLYGDEQFGELIHYQGWREF
jgi:hypothetical protein